MAHQLLHGRLVVVLLALVQVITAAMPCYFNDTAGVYHDLSPMALSKGAYNYSVGDITYYVNVCDFVHGTICSTCLACMVEHDKDYTFLALSIQSFSYNDSVTTIKYAEGFTCGSSEYSTTLKISCGASQGEITNVTFSDCVYTFYLTSMYACGNISITTTTTTTSSTTSPSTTSASTTTNSTSSSPTSTVATISNSSSPPADSTTSSTTSPSSTATPSTGTTSTTTSNTTSTTTGSTKDSSTHSVTSTTHSTTTTTSGGSTTGGFTNDDKDLMIVVLALVAVLFVMVIVLGVFVILLYRRIAANFPETPRSGYAPISINDDPPPPPSTRSSSFIPALASESTGKRVSIRNNPDWEKTWDEQEQRHYFHNKVTGESRWSEDD